MINVKYKETLDYEDISMLHIAEDIETSELYLCCAVDYSELGVEYYAVKIDGSEVLAIKHGEKIRKYFTSGRNIFSFFVDGSSNVLKQLKQVENVIGRKIPSKEYSVEDSQLEDNSSFYRLDCVDESLLLESSYTNCLHDCLSQMVRIKINYKISIDTISQSIDAARKKEDEVSFDINYALVA
ncbi:MAG: hypothetical protein WBI82_09305 [Sphaerochaeta sp.]